MALISRYILDTSAAARMSHPAVAERVAPLIEAGLVATTAALDADLETAATVVVFEQVWVVRRGSL